MESPVQIVESFLQCLSENKRPIGFFLGAGCPFSIKLGTLPLIPSIQGLTEYVKTNIRDAAGEKKALAKVISQLKICCSDEPNVETILSHVRMLKNVAKYEALADFSFTEIDNLECSICASINQCVNKRLPDNTPYQDLAKWIASAQRDKPVEIFTTNYDLLIEESLEKFNIPFFDGFSGSYRPFFDLYSIENDSFPARWVKLWKLHGSINWRSFDHGGDKVFCRSFDESLGALTIHPSHLKYDQSRKLPYLAMIDRLKIFLSTPESVLFIVGYSFGDSHLNETILNGLESSEKSAAFALMFNKTTDKDVANARSYAHHRPNLSVFSRDGATVGTKQYLWQKLPQLDCTNIPVGILDWKPSVDDTNVGEYKLNLGNFVIFGKMLNDISGGI